MTVWEALHAAERREAGGILIREVNRNVLREGGPTVLTRVVDLGARPARERAPAHCTIPDCDSVGWSRTRFRFRSDMLTPKLKGEKSWRSSGCREEV